MEWAIYGTLDIVDMDDNRWYVISYIVFFFSKKIHDQTYSLPKDPMSRNILFSVATKIENRLNIKNLRILKLHIPKMKTKLKIQK